MLSGTAAAVPKCPHAGDIRSRCFDNIPQTARCSSPRAGSSRPIHGQRIGNIDLTGPAIPRAPSELIGRRRRTGGMKNSYCPPPIRLCSVPRTVQPQTGQPVLDPTAGGPVKRRIARFPTSLFATSNCGLISAIRWAVAGKAHRAGSTVSGRGVSRERRRPEPICSAERRAFCRSRTVHGRLGAVSSVAAHSRRRRRRPHRATAEHP